MSKTMLLIILGAITAIILSAVAVFVVLGPRYFQISDQVTGTAPAPTIEVIGITPTSQPIATATATGEGTAVPTPIVTPLPTNTVQPTVVQVDSTSVQYVQALTDVNIRSGPGTNYSVVGWVTGGQTAKVTGINSATGWWRVICPDGSTGSCWVTGAAQYTKATNSPVTQPPPTATSTACTNSAALVSDISVPDGTQFLPSTGFNKTWRIKNTGTCTWDTSYKLVHAGGNLLGAVSAYFPLRENVLPGQSIDLTVNMVSPTTPDTYQSDWKLQSAQGQIFGVGSSGSPFWAKIVVSAGPATTISGLIYQDWNQNGVYDNGEPLVASREVWLVPGTACHVRQDAVAIAYSGADGRYTLSGSFNGSFCVGVVGNGGLDDVASVAVAAGQTLTDIHLKSAVPNMSISGYVWNDYCLADSTGSTFEGSCVADGSGSYRADGMIEPTETYIGGVTVLLRLGSCASDSAVPVFAVTDYNGKYVFNNLTPGTYCVYINATAPENVAPLLPGSWTFPFNGIWYHEIVLQAGASAFPVNFGWDYQLK